MVDTPTKPKVQPPYLYLNRQRLWRGHFFWTLRWRRVDAETLVVAQSENNPAEIFEKTFELSRRLRLPVLGRWRHAYARYHKRQQAIS